MTKSHTISILNDHGIKWSFNTKTGIIKVEDVGVWSQTGEISKTWIDCPTTLKELMDWLGY